MNTDGTSLYIRAETVPDYAALVTARDNARLLGRMRPDLAFVCADIAQAAGLLMKWPDDPRHMAAYTERCEALERMMGAAR